MFTLTNLQANIENTPILKGVNLHIGPGEIHVIMGPNGSGKSTLAKVIAGHPAYQVTDGEIKLLSPDGNESLDLLAMEPDARARAGIFLGMQYPVEVPGITNLGLLREADSILRSQQKEPALLKEEFIASLRPHLELLEMKEHFLNRSVNEGFSGGEKKKNEILQLCVLKPRLAVLDEIDSGLDIDALKVVAQGIKSMCGQKNSFLIITHYQRLLEYLEPDFVHVMVAGKLVRSGDKTLALQLEANGYEGLQTA
ncbi:MAG: Fe-S cluster assembly ATPase SufC [Pseudomonadota bacterium]